MSTNVIQNLPAPVGGVSQVPPELRPADQLADSQNMLPSDDSGLGVRKGTETVATVAMAAPTNAQEFEWSPADGERYLVTVAPNGVAVVDLFTGQPKTVAQRTVASSAPADYSGFFAAPRGFSPAIIGRDVYIAARGYSAAQLVGAVTAPLPDETYITVENGAPSAMYKIEIDGQVVSVRTPDDPPDNRVAIGLAVSSSGDTLLGVSVTPTSSSVTAGQSASVAVGISRPAGFTGSVTVSASSPAGFTCTFGSTTLGTGTTSTILTITAPSTAPAGLTTVTITASGDGQSASATLTLNVSNPSSGGGTGGGGGSGAGSFSLDSTGCTVAAGSSADTAINIVRLGGYAGTVSLSSLSLPAGITVGFTGNPITSGASACLMTVYATSGAAPGNYIVYIQGTDVYAATYTLGVPITVSASGTGGSGGAISLVTSPSFATVPQSYTQRCSIDITRGGGFSGNVDLTLTSVPSGISAAFRTASLPGGTTHTQLEIIVGAGVAPGNYVVSYLAQGPAGTPTATGSVTLYVVAASDQAMSWSFYNSVWVNSGAFDDGANSLTVERTGFMNADITLSVVSTSSVAISGTFDTNPLTGLGDTTALSWLIASGSPAGQYWMLLRASAPGVPDAYTVFTLNRT